MIRTSFIKNKQIVVLVATIFIIGTICGSIYWNKHMITTNYNSYIFNYYRVILPIISCLLSFIYLGQLLGLFNVFLEGFSIPLILLYYINKISLKRIIFGIVNLLIKKTIYLFLLFLLICSLIRILISSTKKDKNYKIMIYNYKRCLVIIFLIILNELFIYFLGNKILSAFHF